MASLVVPLISPPVLASLPPFATFAWALHSHFRNDRAMPRGMRLLSASSLLAFLSFVLLSCQDGPRLPSPRTVSAIACFLLSLLLFLWTVRTTRARPPRLAHSVDFPDSLHMDGPYRLVRHPFYSSYMIFWIGTALAAGAIQAAATALLLCWYVRVARAEERLIAGSPLGAAYRRYRRRTGMLVPKPTRLLALSWHTRRGLRRGKLPISWARQRKLDGARLFAWLLIALAASAASVASASAACGHRSAVWPGTCLCVAALSAAALCGVLAIHRERAALRRDHQEASTLLREYRLGSSDWIWGTDAGLLVNELSGRLFEESPAARDDLLGRPLLELLGDQPDDRLARALADRAPFRDIRVRFHGPTRPHWFSLTGGPVHDRAGRLLGFRGVGTDVTERHEARARIDFLVRHDALTGLLNRAAFLAALAVVAEGADEIALLLLDLDGFGSVNDGYGHLVGDGLLEIVGARVRGAVRENDLAGRIGEDEFAVLLVGSDAAGALDVARRLLRQLSNPPSVGDVRPTLAASIGIAVQAEDGRGAGRLLDRAALALGQAKRRGTCSILLFEDWMECRRSRLRRNSEIAGGLAEGRFFLEFQPIVELASGHTVAAEALVRWQHPTLGELTAASFVPELEASHMMDRLGTHVLEAACLAASSWSEPLGVNVNLSPIQLRSGRFVPALSDILERSGLSPARLSLEVTETVFLEGDESTLSQLRGIQAMGVALVLDDFGTGYSSLGYLRHLVADGIKIDASFTRGLSVSETPATQRDAAIVRAMARLAQDLNMNVVAEGIETHDQVAWLCENGIPLAQGYLLGRPSRVEPRAVLAEGIKAAKCRGQGAALDLLGPLAPDPCV